jgi:hypothetical protein
MVSPATVAETIAGEVDADAGAGQDDEAPPEGVQVSARGLVADCPVDAPQPHVSARTRVNMSRRIVFL